MNMKTYKYLAVAFTALLSFSSCDSFLTTELVDSTPTDNYYKTPEQAYAALTGCYNGLNLIWADGVSFPLASEVMSDNCLGGGGTSDELGYQMLNQFDKSIAPTKYSQFNANWSAYYQAIYRCNVLLQNIEKVNWGTETALKTQYEAEARFLRAYFYFDLVRLFEKVPLVTEPTSERIPQAEPAETYAQIMSDLRFASDNLPATTYSATPNGRVTKWAAESLLARAYLFYSGYYGVAEIGGETKTTALAAVEDVITNSGHGLVGDYTTLWPAASTAQSKTYAGEDNKEVIFSIKYTLTGDYNGNICGNRWLIMTGLREQSVYPYGLGWGFCTIDPKLYNAFSATDTRKFGSAIAIDDEDLEFSKQSNTREYTGYFMKKYSPEVDEDGVSLAQKNGGAAGTNSFMVSQYQDYFVIRYADVLLMAAELGSANAQTYFDEVRGRAGLTSLAPTKENILAERRLEFSGEGLRYWDLLRYYGQSNLDGFAAALIANTSTNLLDSSHPTLSADKIKATRGFTQIPQDEITLIGNSAILTQNAGW
ncbi:MAG: RagB/SusD family nutrient uptake outer membrane protein [Bacteroidetes bacterium]|nr:RagB/SusD family nutrient uptake outer membrane protein [Bacteroidota bacterium]